MILISYSALLGALAALPTGTVVKVAAAKTEGRQI
jgi:hypothetical protein